MHNETQIVFSIVGNGRPFAAPHLVVLSTSTSNRSIKIFMAEEETDSRWRKSLVSEVQHVGVEMHFVLVSLSPSR